MKKWLIRTLTWLSALVMLTSSAAFAVEEQVTFPTLDGYMRGVNLGNWLSQCSGMKEHYDTHITEADFQRLAAWGFDHVRLPFSYEVIERYGFDYLDRAVEWARNAGLNIILDMHKAPHYDFDDPKGEGSTMFLYESQQKEFAEYWRTIAEHYQAEGTNVAFELLNEVTNERPAVWNRIISGAVEAIREVSPERDILIGGTQWNSIDTLEKLPVFEDDDHIIYTFHFYEPFALTHQGARWVEASATFAQPVTYPADLSVYLDYAEHSGRSTALFDGLRQVDATFLENYIQTAVDFLTERNAKVYVGEWGCIRNADVMSRRSYMQDVCALLRRYGIGNAVWNYKDNGPGGFTLVEPENGAVLDDALISILIAKTEADVRAVDIVNPVKVADTYVAQEEKAAEAAYTVQTEVYWGTDGGWMINMDGSITWADNDIVAAPYKMKMMVDEAQGPAVSIKATAGQNVELMYTMFDPVKSGVSIENGVLELMVYVSDTAYLEDTWSVVELISGQTSWIGNSSLRWNLDANVITQPGWNKVTLKLSDAEALGTPFKPNKFKFFYCCATNVPEDVEFRLANIRLLAE